MRILAVLLGLISMPVFATSTSPSSYSMNGICVGKTDPNFDVLCSRYSDNLTCESYPLCRWIESEKLSDLYQIYLLDDETIQ